MGECGKVGKKVIDFRRLLETKIDPNREIKLKETDFFNQMLKTKILLSVYGIELTSSETKLVPVPKMLLLGMLCFGY
jgi:hypothetical protein